MPAREARHCGAWRSDVESHQLVADDRGEEGRTAEGCRVLARPRGSAEPGTDLDSTPQGLLHRSNSFDFGHHSGDGIRPPTEPTNFPGSGGLAAPSGSSGTSRREYRMSSSLPQDEEELITTAGSMKGWLVGSSESGVHRRSMRPSNGISVGGSLSGCPLRLSRGRSSDYPCSRGRRTRGDRGGCGYLRLRCRYWPSMECGTSSGWDLALVGGTSTVRRSRALASVSVQ